jgi:hypothetical protein
MRRTIYKTEYKRVHKLDEIRVRVRKAIIVTDIFDRPQKKLALGSIISLVGAFVIFIFSFGMTHASSTVSYFSDLESSLANTLIAGHLDFTALVSGAPSASVGLTGTDQSILIPVVTPGVGDLPLTYKVTAQKTGGTSDALCNALNVDATSSPFIYSGKLVALSTASTSIVGPWTFALSVPADAIVHNGDTCVLDLVYSGWVDGQTEGIQYHDVKKISLTVTVLSAPVVPVVTPLVQFNALFIPPVDSTTTDASSTPPVDPIVDTPPPPTDSSTTPPVDTTSTTTPV